MAYGAALSLETLYAGQDTQVRPERMLDGLQHVKEAAGEGEKGRRPSSKARRSAGL